MSRRLTNEEFLLRAISKHGDKYDYSKVEYVNMKTKINLICINNHSFHISPDNLLRDRGCPYCIGRFDLVTNLEKFIEKSNLIHNNKFNYDKFEWINTMTPGIITCSEHGDFSQTPNTHLSGCGCKECYYSSLRSNLNKFKLSAKRIHGDFYDYSKVNYIKSNSNVIIICPKHGEFCQSASVHLSGSGCKKCMIDRFRNTYESFLKKANDIHNNFYTYYEESYVDSKTKIRVHCPRHGDFHTSPDNHISKKRGCPSCGKNISKLEVDWLDKLSISVENRQFITKINNRQFKFDAYDPITNTIYEFYGDFWHGNPKIYDPMDFNKSNGITYGDLFIKTMERENYLKSIGYKIISIWESDYKKIYKI